MSNTANDQTPAPPPTVRFGAMATGPFYNTMTTSGHKKEKDAIKEAVDLQLDELYSVVVAKVTVQPGENGEPNITIDMTEYESDEAKRILRSRTS